MISNWEKGINKPDADTIGTICKILSITPNELFGWQTPNNSSIDEKYSQLNTYGKELINTVLELELKRSKNTKS